MHEGYLVDLGEREHEAIERLISLQGIGHGFFSSLGLESRFSWYILRMRANRLIASIAGDVDLLAGRLEWSDAATHQAMVAQLAQACPEAHPLSHDLFAAWKVAAEGGIRWPPSVQHLAAIEAKCAYLPANAPKISELALRSTKQSPSKIRHVRQQVEQLLSIGFDRVALLDIIANPPGGGGDGQAWLAGSAIASRALDAMAPILARRLETGSPAGHYVWSAASVAGADERWRGGGVINELRPAVANPLPSRDAKTRGRRDEMERSLEAILRSMARPLGFPVVLIDCQRCSEVHSVGRSC